MIVNGLLLIDASSLNDDEQQQTLRYSDALRYRLLSVGLYKWMIHDMKNMHYIVLREKLFNI